MALPSGALEDSVDLGIGRSSDPGLLVPPLFKEPIPGRGERLNHAVECR